MEQQTLNYLPNEMIETVMLEMGPNELFKFCSAPNQNVQRLCSDPQF